MVIKPFFPVKIFFAALVLLYGILGTPGVFGTDESRYFVEVQHRFIQRLVWTATENALRYEVEVEQEDERGQYRALLRENTEQLFVEVSLSPGQYRYRVIPYNVFNQAGGASSWGTFVILPAIEPELNDFSPYSFDLDTKMAWVLRLFGSNMAPEAEVYLRRLGVAQIIVPVELEILAGGREARLHFTYDQLIPGIYEIYVRNPGGLDTRMRGFSINHHSPLAVNTSSLDIYMGASWISLALLSKQDLFFSGWAGHFGMVFPVHMILPIQNLFNVGAELTASWYTQEGEMHYQLAENSLLIQKRFLDQKMALTFRAGVGLVLKISNAGRDIRSESDLLDGGVIYGNTGLSFLCHIWKNVYAEAGLNYTLIFTTGKPLNGLRPWVGAGFKF
ncbi:MAG: hypothetical protein FWD36_05450 [Treponema sp.]|nr:hypothetical protein [Treponema sp.]